MGNGKALYSQALNSCRVQKFIFHNLSNGCLVMLLWKKMVRTEILHPKVKESEGKLKNKMKKAKSALLTTDFTDFVFGGNCGEPY